MTGYSNYCGTRMIWKNKSSDCTLFLFTKNRSMIPSKKESIPLHA